VHLTRASVHRSTTHRALAVIASVWLAAGALLIGSAATVAAATSYQNPILPTIPGGGVVETCADPSVMYGAEGEGLWYMYCTTDPLHSDDRDANGNLNYHLIPMFSSPDLVTWTYEGDAFLTRPDWVGDTAGMWAPEIDYIGGRYLLYYAAQFTDGGGSAIGVAEGDSPLGPWVDSGEPVVEPHPPVCCPDPRWTYDPEVIRFGGLLYIYYGSYFGGISVRQLSTDGLGSFPGTQVEVAIANRYEGAEVVQRDGFLYLFASATDCCRGDLTGYSVFVGRSTHPTGPFLDREGNSFMAGRVGGTPVISMNGNRWVGPGHNTVFTDFAGQDWTMYHALDRNDPYLARPNADPTRRPAMLDPLDWVDGWPTVRGGFWASDEPMPAPAAQPGQPAAYVSVIAAPDVPGDRIGWASDEFNSRTLHPRWEWVRPPTNTSFSGGALQFPTQAADLHESQNNASVLTTDAPDGDYMVETRVRLDVPAEGCCWNFTQAGLVIYGGDDAYLKLVKVSIWETRQTEFAKERPIDAAPAGYPRYGNTVVGPPADWTYLRIVKRTVGGEDEYRAYTSQDGSTWVRGGVWTHALGADSSIGLVSMGGTGFDASFDYVRTYEIGGP